MNEFLLIILFSITGSLIGIITGLIPGLHTNNVAILLLALSSAFNLYACILITSAAISHTFLDIIPSTFIGAPEEDTALVVLPAHSMLLEGRGYEVICISAISSLLSILFCFLMLFPFKLILGKPFYFYNILKEIFPWILICISLIVVFTNEYIVKALLIYFLSGIFGFAIIDMPCSFLMKSSPIFPALAGMFGIATLLHSQKGFIPEQMVEEKKIKIKNIDIISGSIAGSIVSILPGVSTAIATTIALAMRKERRKENTIAILSATNTSTNFFVLLSLFIILKARSGFAIVIKEMMHIEAWNDILMPRLLSLLLIAIIIASIMSYFSTLFIGKFTSKNISKIPYAILLKISLVVIILMVFFFNGFIGLLILLTSSCIGIICLKMKVKRSVCMGVLLLPLIVKYFLY